MPENIKKRHENLSNHDNETQINVIKEKKFLPTKFSEKFFCNNHCFQKNLEENHNFQKKRGKSHEFTYYHNLY